MTRKFALISELYEQTAEAVVDSPASWQRFLASACHNYKLRFDEQLLVYAQRPDATAVLEIERWNRGFGRWVNRGAQGIAVFDDENHSRQRLKHYFDISDTHESRYGKPVPLWRMKPEYEAEVIETLENTFGALADKISLGAAIMSASQNAVEDNIPNYVGDLLYTVENSFLADMNEGQIGVLYQRLVQNSVAYTLMSRLNVDTGWYLRDEDFEGIRQFSTPETLNALGFAAGDIAKMGLGEIARNVLALDRENRTFAVEADGQYNEGVNITKERGNQNDKYPLHKSGGLSAAEPEDFGAAQSNAWQVRQSAPKVSEREAQSSVLQSVDQGQTDGAFGRGGAAGGADGGEPYAADGGGGGIEREPESGGYADVGSEDEQSAEQGAGTGVDGGGLRLNFYDRSNEDKGLPFLGNDDTIRGIILTSPHLRATKAEIRAFFEANADKEARIAYITSIFNNDYTEVILEDGRRCGYKTYENVLYLWEGSYLSRTAGAAYDWGVIAAYFEGWRLVGELWDDIKPLPSVDTQLSLFEVPEVKPPAFSFSQEIIDAVLTRGSGVSEGKLRIYEQFQKSLSAQENITFLKNEYGWGGSFPVITGTKIDEQHDGKGITLKRGFGEDASHITLKWDKVEKRIAELIRMDRYLNTKEKEFYPNWLAKQEERRQEQQTENKAAEIWEAEPAEPTEPAEPAERYNFDLSSYKVEAVGKKERFRRNLAAIQVLQKCREEKRFATPEEQTLLANYVGWGGIPEAFDEHNPAWAEEYAELQTVLTADEYNSARESTLTAFYTPPAVIEGIYKVFAQMGFREGNILEPACGIGNFIGMLPEDMQQANMYGVEMDKISAEIARQLYQKSSILAQPFEEAELPDSFFDVVVGNVPFGDWRVFDRRYDKYNFLIHDYFFAKSLDKLRPGGVMALITSKGTLDKENPKVRRYIAQRADLLGAMRLPNDTFKGNAGTEVVSDILILQKRDRLMDIEPDWVHLDADKNGIKMNSYFVQHPEMILGKPQMVSGRFGEEMTVIPYVEGELAERLNAAAANIRGDIGEYVADEEAEEDNSIPADPAVRNFSYTVIGDDIYFRENSQMTPVEVSATAKSRIKAMIEIRESVRKLIELQTEDYPDAVIVAEQQRLNTLYDKFTARFGLINSRGNKAAFGQDSSYVLLSALEVLDNEGNLKAKADIFTKRTIKAHKPVRAVDTASEALAVSIGEKARIDMDYMCTLCGKGEAELYAELNRVIFLNPLYAEGENAKYLMADEYLSGNVREKLRIAELAAEKEPDTYAVNVVALQEVIPKDLEAGEIFVRLGTTWLPCEDIEAFIYELLGTPHYLRGDIRVRYSEYTGEWRVEGKFLDRGNVAFYLTYGTDRINAYKIIEETLNLRDVRIFDYILDANGSKKAVLNAKDTAVAQGKQQMIKQAFGDWIWQEPERRARLTRLYNDKFNSIRPREYDGSHIIFHGMNPEIELRPHQINAVARVLYGGNTLLGHIIGAGKTFEMAAAAQESKRLGLCQKSLFVVPNHLTEQWAAEYLQLYPAANILVATQKDFEMKNRRRFCSRIATGDYDAVIIGHSQFEKIPMSIERQQRILRQQLDEITQGIRELKANRGDKFSIKQMERSKKGIKDKLAKLNDQSRKDDVVTFEELGVDRIFVDEAHYYKNLAAFSKMRNVAGISQTEAKKSSDLYMKCRYLDEITGGKGIIFATGTPVSNSMVELYTMQKYLQYNTLAKNNLLHFDAWASTFGETVTAMELAPEGTGYRLKTRFARFYNLPELMAMFKEVADIQTAEMLKLPVPKANRHTVVLQPSEQQAEMVEGLAERAERVRNKMVDSTIDNMLLITNDGRKLALDQRLANELLPDSDTGKIAACAENVFKIWQDTADRRSAQMVFCDLSTPKADGSFNVYDDLRNKLIAKGMPGEEIAFIHYADTELQKKEMFGKVRSGEIRVLLGSTQKMGAGTNVQDRLIALHHLDCPWRPSDLQQREGRIIRQGNENDEVDIYTYVTENTFDSYLYQLVGGKQKFIGQIMTDKSPVRSAEDIDETALSYAEIKALCAGNPYIKEKMDLDIEVARLKLLKANHLNQRYALEDKIIKDFPQRIAAYEQRIAGYTMDMAAVAACAVPEGEFTAMEINGVTYTDKKAAGTALLNVCKTMTSPGAVSVGRYRGLELKISFDSLNRQFEAMLQGKLQHSTALGTDIFGNIQRIDNLLNGLPERLTGCEAQLENTRAQLAAAKIEVEKPFAQEDELKQKLARLDELTILLNMDKQENEILDDNEPDMEPERDKKIEMAR